MRNKRKEIGICVVFLIVLYSVCLMGILTPSKELSKWERRRLAQAPSVNLDNVVLNTFSGEFENYALDQFPYRDSFRVGKALFHKYILNQADNHQVYVIEDEIYKSDYPIKKKELQQAIDRISGIYDEYLQGMNCYYAVIPEKNWYQEDKEQYLVLDYNEMTREMKRQISKITNIDLSKVLQKKNYYKTDLHWRQETLIPVVEKLTSDMGNPVYAPLGAYTLSKLDGFYGGYFGQAALPLKGETMYYLESKELEESKVKVVEKNKNIPIYDLEKFKGLDPYDLYLSGPSAIVEIENPNASTQKELLLFRDSFGSSIAPLLIESYQKITLIDLRYISSKILSEYIEFNQQDVLFLYSTQVLNQGSILR